MACEKCVDEYGTINQFFFDYLLLIWIIENNTNLYYHIIGIDLNEAKNCVAKGTT